jgi:tetratricopeptide (TPR) repeat protein
MSEQRLQQLLAFLEEDPDDAFTIYAVATEYLKTDIDKAREYYELLLRKKPAYVPTYYHAAHLYLDLGMDEEAVATFEKGITVAQQQGDQLALRELRNAYDQYQFESDD